MGYYAEKIRRMVGGTAAQHGITNRPDRVGDSCIIRVNDRFFIVAKVMFGNIGRIIVIRISRNQAESLARSGVKVCQVYDELPGEVRGRTAELKCVFFIDHQAFLVFEILNASGESERLIVARIPICHIYDQGLNL